MSIWYTCAMIQAAQCRKLLPMVYIGTHLSWMFNAPHAARCLLSVIHAPKRDAEAATCTYLSDATDARRSRPSYHDMLPPVARRSHTAVCKLRACVRIPRSAESYLIPLACACRCCTDRGLKPVGFTTNRGTCIPRRKRLSVKMPLW